MLAEPCYKRIVPKIVNPEQRREEIADALFDVIRDEGFAKVSLATVAQRAGLAIGSVRHFVGTREEMIRFAFDTASARIHQRVLARARPLLDDVEGEAVSSEERLQTTVDLLCEFLPIDDARRAEAVVWLEFETAARTDAQLAETSRRAAAQLARLIEVILESAGKRGALADDVDVTVETARLSALIDGLTIRAALHSDLVTPDTARRVVAAHLHQLRAAS